MTPSTCDLYDRFGEEARVLPPVFEDFGGRVNFAGEVVTIKCFEDNSRIKELLGTPGAGRVLVVDGGGSLRCALMGDMIAKDAVTQGWAGVVIFGCIRDREALRQLPLGIRALGCLPRKSVRRGEGQSQLPIEIDGVRCVPGDWLFADADGILVLDGERGAAVAGG